MLEMTHIVLLMYLYIFRIIFLQCSKTKLLHCNVTIEAGGYLEVLSVTRLFSRFVLT